ncbi:MAG: transcriptional regulator [Methanosarcinales archaeon]|jgi:predicted transcriptional regulator|nr:transcriptional regulator [Methanosarcinales archaeon]MCK4811506.1 transcriptional regulator [Methanosarcinales archaeon]
MKELSIQVMGDREHEISDLLQNLELSKIVSKTVACLANTTEMTSRELEAAAGIRQPEVSAAMRVLRAKEWVVEREEKKKLGKGRPVKVYRLNILLRDIVETLEKEKISSEKEMMSDLGRLRELA